MKTLFGGFLLALLTFGAHAQDSTSTARAYVPVTQQARPVGAVRNVQTTGTRQMGKTRSFHKGARGGCYYLSSGGKKVYVDKSYCQ